MEDWSSEQQKQEKNIEITINTIENVIKNEDISVSFIIEHNGIVLGQSDPTIIAANCGDVVHVIEFVSTLTTFTNDKEQLNLLVSTPILIKAIQNVEDGKEEKPIVEKPKRKSVFTSKSSSISTITVLGICNLDLFPVILGEHIYIEKLILETPKFVMDGTLVAWQNLPLITVTVIQDEVPFFEPNEIVNFLNITVESIYNLPKNFTENLQYKIGTIAYIDNEVPENIIFENGVWTKWRDVERTKRWNNLGFLENRARLSKYKLDCDYIDVKNKFKKQFNLTDKVNEDIPRVEWNSLNRSIMWTSGIEAMKNHIMKHRYWPFQIMITGQEKSSTLLYQCYVDLSELIFPGRNSCRVVEQLYVYNPADLSEKVGLENNIFVVEKDRKASKERDKKSKTSKHSPSDTEGTDTVREPSMELISEDTQPTVIVIDVQLHTPLLICTVKEDFKKISDLITKTKKKPHYVYTSELAEKQFINCMQKMTEYITKLYRDFRESIQQETKGQEKYCFDSNADELTCFTQYLYKTGEYLFIRNTLRSKIPLLLDQKFLMPTNLVNSNETQNLITSIYTYLVEQMHIALNTTVENRFTQDLVQPVNSKLMYFFAEEAYELGDVNRARRYYTMVVTSNKSDPKAWSRYAIFLKQLGDVERAKECCLEAIALNRHHPIAWFIYALLLLENKEYTEVEIFLRSLVKFHPRFLECWAVLHIFYLKTEYYPGIDITRRTAEKCMRDKSREITFDLEPLAWTMVHCPRDNLYLLIATFLLKLHFYEFAGIALAQAMSNSDRSISILYYMAVEHYLSGRYEDALSHLKEAECSYGLDYSISSLLGHCYQKMGNNEKAIECYDFARMLFNRPMVVHLVELRLGHHYYDNNDFDRAKKMFLSICESSPTASTWLGLGMTCYELDEIEEAEIALTEANAIDNCNSDIWGYLCLINMTLGRYDEFSQCYAEMIKNNLDNEKLWLRITKMMTALDYKPLDLVTEINDFDDSESKQSQEQFEQ